MLLGCNQKDKGPQVPFTHWLCVDDKWITQNPHKSFLENLKNDEMYKTSTRNYPNQLMNLIYGVLGFDHSNFTFISFNWPPLTNHNFYQRQ